MECIIGVLAIVVIFAMLAGGIPIITRRDGDTHINYSRQDREWYDNDSDTFF